MTFGPTYNIPAPDVERIPPGSLVDYAGATAPPGWLICDGSAVSRVTYRPLFEAIGAAFGVGDGSTTFNIPDLRDRTSVGKSATKALAATGGSADAVVVAHVHSHAHTQQLGGTITTASPAAGIGVIGESNTSTVTTDATSTGVSGTGANLPPYVALNKIIKC